MVYWCLPYDGLTRIGEIIKEGKTEIWRNATQKQRLLHPLFMIGIALSGFILGFRADKFGRKFTIYVAVLAVWSFHVISFLAANRFRFYIWVCITSSGVAVAVLRPCTKHFWWYIHVLLRSILAHDWGWAFFWYRPIFGPLIVGMLWLREGVDWKLLYVLAVGMCTY